MERTVACGNCGGANTTGAVICAACGAILAAYTAPAGASADDVAHPPAPGQQAAGPAPPDPPSHAAINRMPPALTRRGLPVPDKPVADGVDPGGASLPVPPSSSASQPFPASHRNGDDLRERPPGAQVSGDTVARQDDVASQLPATPFPSLDAVQEQGSLLAPDLPTAGTTLSGRAEDVISERPRSEIARALPAAITEPAEIAQPSLTHPLSPPVQPEERLKPQAQRGGRPSRTPSSKTRAAVEEPRANGAGGSPAPTPGRDPLASVPGQTFVLVGLGLLLTSCLLGALGWSGDMPVAVVLAAFCSGPIGVLLIVAGVVILEARRSRRLV